MADVAKLQIEVSTTGVDKALKDLRGISSEGSKAEEGVVSLSSAFKGLAASIAVVKTYETSKEIALLAARYETLGATLGVMGNNIGHSRAEMDAYQAALEKTGISMLRARGAMQVMAAAQVDVAHSSKLARVAQDAATLAGINSSEAFNNLIRGIATGEVRIIRHMGIMVNFKDAYHRYAESIHKSVGALTEKERAEARAQEVMLQGAKRAGVYEAAMTTAGKQLLSMERYTENLKVQLGETFNPTTNVLVFALAEALKAASNELREWKESGDQAVVAAKIADYARSGVAALSYLKNFIVDHIDDIKTLVVLYGVYKALDLAGPILKVIASIREKAMASKVAAASVIRDQIAESEARLASLQTTRAQFLAQQELTWHQFKSNAAKASDMALNRAINAELGRQVVLKQNLANATNLAASAASGFRAVIAGLGGPIGVAVLALTTLYMTYQRFKDKTKEHSDDVGKAVDDEIARLKEETARNLRVVQAIKEGKSPEEVRAAETNVNEVPEMKKLIGTIVDWQVKLADAKNAYAALESKQISASEQAEGRHRLELQAAKENIASIEKEVAAGEKKRQQLAESWQLQKSSAAEREKLLGGMNKPAQSAGEEGNARQQNEYTRRLLEYNLLIEAAHAKQAGYSDHYLENLKTEQKLAKELKEIDDKTSGKKPILTANQAVELKKLAAAAYDAKKEADSFAASQEDLAREMKLGQDPIKDLTTWMNDLDKQTKEMGKSAEELALIKMVALKDNVWLAEGAFEALEDRLKKTIEANRKAKEDLSLSHEAQRLNDRKDVEDQALTKLNKLKEAGLVKDVYNKMWMEIQMKGNSAMSALVNGMDIAANKMADAFANFALTGKLAFKDMVASILADLAKLMMQKAFTQLLMFGINLLTSSGSSYAGGTNNPGNYGSDPEGSLGTAAYGGPIVAGREYVVGEKGPEIFRSGVSGAIIPNGAMSGGGIVMFNSITFQSDGRSSKHSEGDSNKRGKELGDSLFAAMDQWAVMQMRPNGLLDFRGASR